VDDILQLAQKLGVAIAQSPQGAGLRGAKKQLDSQPDVKKLMDDYRRQSDRIATLEREKKPVEVEDKRKLQETNDQLVANDFFKQYMAAQVEYLDLMRKVDAALNKALAEIEGK
jgi:cell fate (sporulation/competence/biofilm development) regulator YlbF (YheA/YmcA/DUF963 family)